MKWLRGLIDSLRRDAGPLGRRGEDLAVETLKRAGYAILDRNARFGRHEIDIIAREGDTIAFVEVKTRRSGDFAGPEDSVTPQKQQHLIAAARRYKAKRPDPEAYYRFDVVSIVLPETGAPRIEIIRDAFRPQSRRPR